METYKVIKKDPKSQQKCSFILGASQVGKASLFHTMLLVGLLCPVPLPVLVTRCGVFRQEERTWRTAGNQREVQEKLTRRETGLMVAFASTTKPSFIFLVVLFLGCCTQPTMLDTGSCARLKAQRMVFSVRKVGLFRAVVCFQGGLCGCFFDHTQLCSTCCS